MTPDPDVIFTYGTLRPGLGERAEAQEFRTAAHLLGPATFQGALYAIDWYPGVVESTDPTSVVTGDLFEIGSHPGFFDKLDTYEGCAPPWPEPYEYIRTIRDVRFDGQMIPAWIYLFNWTLTDQHLRIKSGDFADHVAQQP